MIIKVLFLAVKNNVCLYGQQYVIGSMICRCEPDKFHV